MLYTAHLGSHWRWFISGFTTSSNKKTESNWSTNPTWAGVGALVSGCRGAWGWVQKITMLRSRYCWLSNMVHTILRDDLEQYCVFLRIFSKRNVHVCSNRKHSMHCWNLSRQIRRGTWKVAVSLEMRPLRKLLESGKCWWRFNLIYCWLLSPLTTCNVQSAYIYEVRLLTWTILFN